MRTKQSHRANFKTPTFVQSLRLPRGMRSLFLWGHVAHPARRGSNFNPRNIIHIHQGTYFVAPEVKIFAFLDLEQN